MLSIFLINKILFYLLQLKNQKYIRSDYWHNLQKKTHVKAAPINTQLINMLVSYHVDNYALT
jgi:hypothetical protein